MALSAVCGAGVLWPRLLATGALPPAPNPGDTALFDLTPIVVTVEAGGERADWPTDVHELLSNVVLWRRMHLAQWNGVPASLRRRALTAMMTRYRRVLTDPCVWDRMDPAAWDAVPQPVRTAAYRHMVAYWAGYYRVGADAGLAPGLVADTLAAIVMSESWFDHRALHRHHAHGLDIGLAQASDYARIRLRALARAGHVDVAFDDREYLDPWKATRFVAVWMTQLLRESGGDLDLAVRAYHRGLARAHDRRGDRYLATVQQRLRRYIRNQGAPPAWNDARLAARAVRQQAWPWVAARRASTDSHGASARVPVADRAGACRTDPAAGRRAGGTGE
ncbi:MAG: transglycosylase SLT domain-containing protein [Vicinamibacterales bacterium]